MTTATATTPLVGSLILARLLAAGKTPVPPKKLRQDLARFFKEPPDAEQWQSYLDELQREGLVTLKPCRLTDAGRADALKFLGLEKLPNRFTWSNAQGLLIPLALGLANGSAENRKWITKPDGLRAYLLKKHFDLSIHTTASLKAALEALACKLICNKLGLEPSVTLGALQTTVLNQLLAAPQPLDKGQLERHVPVHVAGATSNTTQHLRQAILLNWLHQSLNGTPTFPPTDQELRKAELDLPAFAATVQAVARDCPSGWFGDNKVFINHVWRRLRQEPGFPALELAEFKRKLVEANQAGLLRLSRADLVQVMDSHDVQESETAYLNATFHFILVEKPLP